MQTKLFLAYSLLFVLLTLLGVAAFAQNDTDGVFIPSNLDFIIGWDKAERNFPMFSDLRYGGIASEAALPEATMATGAIYVLDDGSSQSVFSDGTQWIRFPLSAAEIVDTTGINALDTGVVISEATEVDFNENLSVTDLGGGRIQVDAEGSHPHPIVVAGIGASASFAAVADYTISETTAAQDTFATVVTEAANNYRGVEIIMQGDFYFTDSLNIATDNIHFRGFDRCTWINKNNYPADDLGMVIFTSSSVTNIVFENMHIEGQRATYTSTFNNFLGVAAGVGVSNCAFINLSVNGFAGRFSRGPLSIGNSRIIGCDFSNLGTGGINWSNVTDCIVSDCKFVNIGATGSGIGFTSGDHNAISNCVFTWNNKAISVNSNYTSVSGITIENTTSTGISSGGTNNTFSSVAIEGAGQSGFVIDGNHNTITSSSINTTGTNGINCFGGGEYTTITNVHIENAGSFGILADDNNLISGVFVFLSGGTGVNLGGDYCEINSSIVWGSGAYGVLFNSGIGTFSYCKAKNVTLINNTDDDIQVAGDYEYSDIIDCNFYGSGIAIDDNGSFTRYQGNLFADNVTTWIDTTHATDPTFYNQPRKSSGVERLHVSDGGIPSILGATDMVLPDSDLQDRQISFSIDGVSIVAKYKISGGTSYTQTIGSGGGGSSTFNALTDTNITTGAQNDLVAYTADGVLEDIDAPQIDILGFDRLAADIPAAGSLSWDDTEGMLQLGLEDDSVVKIPETMVLHVRNISGLTLTKGQAVENEGTTGQVISVTPTSAGTSEDVIGLILSDIANNATGYVVSAGIIEDVSTVAFAQGDKLYPHETENGGIQNTVPSYPNNKHVIGFVQKSHQTQGQIEVQIDLARALTESNDIDTTGLGAGSTLEHDGTKWVIGTDDVAAVTTADNDNLTTDGVGNDVAGAPITASGELALEGDWDGDGTGSLTLRAGDGTGSNTPEFSMDEPNGFRWWWGHTDVAGTDILAMQLKNNDGLYIPMETTGVWTDTAAAMYWDDTANELVVNDGADDYTIGPATGTSTTHYVNPIDRPVIAAQQFDEFNSGVLDSNIWSLVSGATNPVDIIGAPGDVVEMNSTTGQMLLQTNTTISPDIQGSYTIADGSSAVFAFDINAFMDGTNATGDIQIAFSARDSGGGGDRMLIVLQTESTEEIIVKTNDGTSSVVHFNITYFGRMYARIIRESLTYHGFISFDGNSWIPLQEYTFASALDQLRIYISQAASDGDATKDPIVSVDWVRIGTDDEYPFTHQ